MDILHIFTYHTLLPLKHIMLGNWNNSNVSFYSSVELNVILIHTLSLYRIRKMVSPHSSKCQKFIHHFAGFKDGYPFALSLQNAACCITLYA